MPDALLSSEAAVQDGEKMPASRISVNLLAYVHLRNIYGSTGAGRVARQMVEHLAKREDVHLRILADAADHARILPLVKQPWDTFSYRLFRHDTSRQQAQWFFLERPRAESYWPEAQVVYCTAESYVPVRKARLVVTLHDAAYLEPNAHRMDGAFQKQKLKWRFLYRKLVRRADMFHIVSQFSAERLIHFFPEIRNRVRVVHNAVTQHFFQPVTAEGTTYLRTAGLLEKPYLLVPGGLHFRKNAELILEAWPIIRKSHPDLSLVIVNHSNPEYVQRAKCFGDSISILGFVPDDGLRALYASAQVVWFPSRYEGFGLPVIEAMACGAPVVASDSSSLPEISGDAALLACSTKASDHAEAIHSLLTSESLRQEVRRRGMERASVFTWDRAAGQLKTHLETLL